MHCWVLVICVIGIIFTSVNADDTIDLSFRCSYCNAGYCEEKTMNMNSCEVYQNPCTGFVNGYYKIVDNDDGEPVITKYVTSDCTSILEVGTVIQCDSCYSSASVCSVFFKRCTSYWWWIIPICIFGCLVLAFVSIGVVALIKKRQRQQAYAQGAVDPVTYQQASYQSVGQSS